jgi:hypothetical protein
VRSLWGQLIFRINNESAKHGMISERGRSPADYIAFSSQEGLEALVRESVLYLLEI